MVIGLGFAAVGGSCPPTCCYMCCCMCHCLCCCICHMLHACAACMCCVCCLCHCRCSCMCHCLCCMLHACAACCMHVLLRAQGVYPFANCWYNNYCHFQYSCDDGEYPMQSALSPSHLIGGNRIQYLVLPFQVWQIQGGYRGGEVDNPMLLLHRQFR